MRNKERGPLQPLKNFKGREGNFTKLPDHSIPAESLPPETRIDPNILLNQLNELDAAGGNAGLKIHRRRRKH